MFAGVLHHGLDGPGTGNHHIVEGDFKMADVDEMGHRPHHGGDYKALNRLFFGHMTKWIFRDPEGMAADFPKIFSE